MNGVGEAANNITTAQCCAGNRIGLNRDRDDQFLSCTDNANLFDQCSDSESVGAAKP